MDSVTKSIKDVKGFSKISTNTSDIFIMQPPTL